MHIGAACRRIDQMGPMSHEQRFFHIDKPRVQTKDIRLPVSVAVAGQSPGRLGHILESPVRLGKREPGGLKHRHVDHHVKEAKTPRNAVDPPVAGDGLLQTRQIGFHVDFGLPDVRGDVYGQIFQIMRLSHAVYHGDIRRGPAGNHRQQFLSRVPSYFCHPDIRVEFVETSDYALLNGIGLTRIPRHVGDLDRSTHQGACQQKQNSHGQQDRLVISHAGQVSNCHVTPPPLLSVAHGLPVRSTPGAAGRSLRHRAHRKQNATDGGHSWPTDPKRR